jgi:DNA-directed RNA polymerase subunit RPC12/RpoP
MEITFNCPQCSADLVIDDSWAGQAIECPTCQKEILVPTETAGEPAMPPPAPARSPAPAPAPAPAAEEEFVFNPTAGGTGEIQKPTTRSLEVMAKGDKKVTLKTFRREDCRKDGNDRFDEVVSEFLRQIPDGDLVSISPVHYSYPGKEPGQIFQDYGVTILFKQ